MRYFDAHVHFNCKNDNPYLDLKDRLLRNQIEKCVLILNTETEQSFLWQNLEQIRNDQMVYSVAGILDVHEAESLSFFSDCQEKSILPCIKLHPRLTNITKYDFESVLELINQIEYDSIIIDDFIYGPQIENHIGTELAIYLAQNLKHKNIVLAHAGGCEILKSMLQTRPLPNIFYDYSLTCNYLSNTSIRADMLNGLNHWTSRIMFGTDYPDFDFEQSISEMERMFAEIDFSEEKRETVFFENAMKVFRRSF